MSFDVPVLHSIRELSESRDAWFCDIWGVLHNGEAAFSESALACRAFRGRGGVVVLISNSPRPHDAIVPQLEELGIDAGCYDAIVTSGDVTRALVSARLTDTMFHLGPGRDRAFFDGLPVRFAGPEEAACVVCTGLVDDETETPDDYRAMLSSFAARGATMICANPDLVVERGNRLIPCAGALAARYASLGGTVLQAGKPYPPIYEVAFRQLKEGTGQSAVLAIGDGIDTDIRGAANIGLDSIYIASRVSMGDGAAAGMLSASAVSALFADRPFRPLAAMQQLKW